MVAGGKCARRTEILCRPWLITLNEGRDALPDLFNAGFPIRSAGSKCLPFLVVENNVLQIAGEFWKLERIDGANYNRKNGPDEIVAAIGKSLQLAGATVRARVAVGKKKDQQAALFDRNQQLIFPDIGPAQRIAAEDGCGASQALAHSFNHGIPEALNPAVVIGSGVADVEIVFGGRGAGHNSKASSMARKKGPRDAAPWVNAVLRS